MINEKSIKLRIAMPAAALILGIAVAVLLIALTGVSPISALRVLIDSGFGFGGRVAPFFITLGSATPLMLTGLAAMLGFKVGVFCIAQECQYVFGAIMAAWLGASLELPPVIAVPFIIICAIVAGGIFGFIPAFLKVKLGVNEIISSIMLNNTATLVLEYLVAFPLRADAGQKAQSEVIERSYWLPEFVQGSRFGISFIIGVLLLAFFFMLIWKTRWGYKMRMVGENISFADYGGVRSSRVIILTLVVSGAVAGLAGCLEVLGNYHRIMTGFSSGLGFDGLSVAMLGLSHPVGVFIVALLLAGIRQGAQLGLQISLSIPRELGGVLIAMVIFFVAIENAYKPFVERLVGGRRKKDAREKEAK